jgi:hypothetical protein
MGTLFTGGVKLLNYRLYRLDGAGRIDAADWIEAADDDEACREASARYPTGRYELWEGRRLVDCSEGRVARA